MAVVIYHMETNVQVVWDTGHMYCIVVDTDGLVHWFIHYVKYRALSIGRMSRQLPQLWT